MARPRAEPMRSAHDGDAIDATLVRCEPCGALLWPRQVKEHAQDCKPTSIDDYAQRRNHDTNQTNGGGGIKLPPAPLVGWRTRAR